MLLEEAARLDKLVTPLRREGKVQEAIPLAERSLELREKALGSQHPDLIASLDLLAALYKEQGAYSQAEPLLVRALDTTEKAYGLSHRRVASHLNNLATLYRAQGAYARAEPLYVRAVEIEAKTFNSQHPSVGASLQNLALLYKLQGLHARAEPLYIRALKIQEEVLGKQHPKVATIINNLATLYAAQGMYRQAELLLIRALDILERARGPQHPDVATSLNNLAVLYRSQGAYAKAEPLYLRALEIREKSLGPQHPDVATSLNNLAVLYRAQGAASKAEPLLVRALEIRKKALGPAHRDVAGSLNNLAVFYEEQGSYAQAEPLYIRALQIKEKALGPEHPDVATSLNNLAMFYNVQGSHEKAESLYVRALDIYEKALGPQHPDVATSLGNLAMLYEAQGAHDKAESLLARAAEIRERHLRVDLAPLSEPRKRAMMTLLQGETEALVSLHADSLPMSHPALELALTTVLRRKSRVLDSLTDHEAVLRAHLTPQLRDKLGQLTEARAQLSTRLRAPFDPLTAKSERAELATLRARIDALETELNTASVEFRAQSAPVTIAELQAVLPRGTVLIEIVRYHRFDARQAQPWQEARYLAYLLSWQGSPKWVALGDAARIDAGVDAVLATMHKDSSAEATRAALRSLDTLVLAPIRDQLSGVSHIIISPDSKLNLVPFDALIDPRGHYALEQWLISYVTSGRDLLRLAARQVVRSAAAVVADPDYGGRGTPFSRLPGTLAEVQEIQRHFDGLRTLTGGQATKAALANLAGPSVLHVATHGFYARGSAPAASVVARPLGVRERGMVVESAIPAQSPLPPSEDPTEALDRAGLALAGANVRADSIASAREIAGWDWWGTQLVVLSACETGVGAVPSGEGVYGLRRALILAGAQSQVVSLWNVNDAAARELMRELYAELARGTGRAQALRHAKLAILHQPRFANPYYWAAFIPAGDWSPLDKDTMRIRDPSR